MTSSQGTEQRGTFTPRPGAAPLPRMVAAQARLEARLLLRNGEQLLLTVILPVLLLVAFSVVDLVDTDVYALAPGERRVDALLPGLLALAVFSTAFTGQAIATGFERRYAVLKRLGATPLPRHGLLAGKVAAVLAVEALQVGLLCAVGLALGWSPGRAVGDQAGGPGGGPARGALLIVLAALLIALGTAACTALALLLAGTLRAEATLAVANLLYVLLLLGSGIFVPLERFPDAARAVLALNPLAALADGLTVIVRDALAAPGALVGPVAVLACWAVVAGAAAARAFRWE